MNTLSFADNPQVLVRLRWYAIIFQFLSVSIASALSLISYQQFVLSIISLIPIFIFNQILSQTSYKSQFTFLQLFIDLAIAFLLLFINGGLSNPFYLIILIHIFLAPFFLKVRSSVFFILFGITLLYSLKYSPFTFAESAPPLWKDNIPAIALMTVSLTIWQLATWLVRELRKLNQRIESLQSYSQRIDKFRSLGLLASGICHELGTPLNTALMKLERMEKKSFSSSDLAVTTRSLSKCAESLKKLNTKVHDLDEDFYKEEVSLAETLNEVALEYSKNYPLAIEVKNNLHINHTIQIPKLLFTRSLIDIFDNARDAKASLCRVSLSLIKEPNPLIELSIKDDGEGFIKEVIDNIGSPFVTSKENGTGLGLYQLINTVNYIGGKVQFLNHEAGALIVIQLPKEALS